jgi:hypothetical protein
MEADLATKEADRQNQLELEAQKQAFEREKLAAEYAFKNQELAMKRDLELMKLNQQAMQHEDQRADSARAETMKYASEEVKAGGDKPVSKRKSLVRGSDGRATHIESDTGEKWAIKRGPDGRASHLEMN